MSGDGREAVGRMFVREGWLSADALARLRVSVGLDADGAPDALPFAHWAWFADVVADPELGTDGHPARGRFLPALPHLPRRMFAASAVERLAPLELDAPATMRAEIVRVEPKVGSSGPLAFVDVQRTITQHGSPRVQEVQTYVYREPSATPLPLPPLRSADVPSDAWTPNALQLFRFSAATFNAHRIHYDESYARGVEGYPALVVQGPLVAARLAVLAAVEGEVATLRYRAQMPAFAAQPIALTRAGDGCFQAVRCDGETVAILQVEYR